ncbi:MAG: hypothetical protein HY321_20140 [Armatimonadetes bacterium]|nr:hypothetical protein [Armatimonadota bacterium]
MEGQSGCVASGAVGPGITCARCGAQYERLPGIRCPRCGNALVGCEGCRGCAPAGGGSGEGIAARLRAWWKEWRGH